MIQVLPYLFFAAARRLAVDLRAAVLREAFLPCRTVLFETLSVSSEPGSVQEPGEFSRGPAPPVRVRDAIAFFTFDGDFFTRDVGF
jgi:hypothetical protein